MKQDKTTIKTYFETGDKPTQEQYSNLVDSYVDSKQPEGEANRRFVINETGEVNVAPTLNIPEYTLSEITGNKLALLKDGVAVKEIDLTQYIDDTNLARLVSGTVDSNGIATFTRDDNSTFTVDLSNLKGDLNLQQVTDLNNITTNYIEIQNKNGLIINQGGNSNYQSVYHSLGSSHKRNNLTGVFNENSILFFNSGGFNNSIMLTYDYNQIMSNGQKRLIIPYKNGTLATTEDIPQIQAGTNITIDNTNPQSPIINAVGASNSQTTLSYNSSTRTIESSTGNNIVLPLADATKAGLMKPDFYEEGTFNPVLGGGTYTNGSTTGSSYVRIGNLIHTYLQIQNINGNGNSLDLNIGGMPYPASASGYWISSNMTLFKGSNYTNPDKLIIDFNVGSGTIRFRELNGTYIDTINFTNGEIRLNITYRTNIYTP
ncbi:hypothetical protein [Tenacibaculum sp. nBUS_03]|uniref:hypothetical protein n=1 Tax=Tenacibaculum sp. nBUS_03 TaxID=3395320 RepID=UPI003EB966FE